MWMHVDDTHVTPAAARWPSGCERRAVVSCRLPAQARAQDVEGDGVGLRVRVGDDPQGHEEGQGRAERDDNGGKLWVACHVSHVAFHKSHVTRHTSHVTRHTSHVTRYLACS